MGNREGQHQEEEVIAFVAARVARRYTFRVFWADEEDLRQEALSWALDARLSWDPAVGVPLGAYLWRACMSRLRDYLWRQSAPVSAPAARLHELRGLWRAELDDTIVDDLELEVLLDDKRWTTSVRDQLLFLFRVGRSEREAQATMRVVLDEDKPSVVAREMGLDVHRVYRLADSARRKLSSNEVLFQLWSAR